MNCSLSPENEEDDDDSAESFVMVDNMNATTTTDTLPESSGWFQDEATRSAEEKCPQEHDNVGASSLAESDILTSLASYDCSKATTAILLLQAKDTPFMLLTMFQVTQALCGALLRRDGIMVLPESLQSPALWALRHVVWNSSRLFLATEPLDGSSTVCLLLKTLQATDDANIQTTSLECCLRLLEVTNDEVNMQVCQWLVQRFLRRMNGRQSDIRKDSSAVRLMEPAVKWFFCAANSATNPQMWEETLRLSSLYKKMFWDKDVWGHETLVDLVHLLMTLAGKPTLRRDGDTLKITKTQDISKTELRGFFSGKTVTQMTKRYK